MCENKPGVRCAADTHTAATAAAGAYQQTYPDGPALDALTRAETRLQDAPISAGHQFQTRPDPATLPSGLRTYRNQHGTYTAIDPAQPLPPDVRQDIHAQLGAIGVHDTQGFSGKKNYEHWRRNYAHRDATDEVFDASEQLSRDTGKTIVAVTDAVGAREEDPHANQYWYAAPYEDIGDAPTKEAILARMEEHILAQPDPANCEVFILK